MKSNILTTHVPLAYDHRRIIRAAKKRKLTVSKFMAEAVIAAADKVLADEKKRTAA